MPSNHQSWLWQSNRIAPVLSATSWSSNPAPCTIPVTVLPPTAALIAPESVTLAEVFRVVTCWFYFANGAVDVHVWSISSALFHSTIVTLPLSDSATAILWCHLPRIELLFWPAEPLWFLDKSLRPSSRKVAPAFLLAFATDNDGLLQNHRRQPTTHHLIEAVWPHLPGLLQSRLVSIFKVSIDSFQLLRLHWDHSR